MRIILGVILVLFAMLIGQLAYLQLVYGSRFKAEVQKKLIQLLFCIKCHVVSCMTPKAAF